MNRKNKSQRNPLRVLGREIRYGNDLTLLISEFLHCCEKMREQHEENLEAWKAKERAYKKDHTKAHPDPKPKTYPVIRNTADLERVVELERLLGEPPTNASEGQTREERLAALMAADDNVKEMIAEAWRRTRPLLDGGGAGENKSAN